MDLDVMIGQLEAVAETSGWGTSSTQSICNPQSADGWIVLECVSLLFPALIAACNAR